MEVATYVRVSMEEQSLERQLKKTHEYSQRHFDTPPTETYRDKSTGTNTDRSDFHQMLNDVENGKYDAVIANSISRISRSIRDLDETVEHIVDNSNTELHIISEGLQMTGEDDPYQKAMLQLLGVFAELEAEMTRQRVKEGIRTRMENEDYHHGPAPLGFEKDDGYLIEAANFDRVRSVLELVEDGELSKRKAARELDSSRRTINRALDRPELYSLS
ncbi:recombinase family protein [Halovenus rubra]|uniref:Recombinase family protein n=2 Tax=Halovenus rubra TaxID=869890 RepID=A0ACC7E509_9EURY|nr:recombinase family protein [Halovenus rubra]